MHNKKNINKKKILSEAMFLEKIRKIKEYIFSETDNEEARGNQGSNEDKLFCVFLSICNMRERTTICHGVGRNLLEAFSKAEYKAKAWIRKKNYSPKWIKVEIVKNARVVPIEEVKQEMFSSYNEFFRHGISFDRDFKIAFTEAELNGNRLITYREKKLDIEAFNKYLRRCERDELIEFPDTLILFDCLQWFIDEHNEVFELYYEGLDVGRRVVERIDKALLLSIINTGAEFLLKQMKDDGSFYYGYYPIFHKLIPNYNILRHSSSLWSMICAAELSKNPNLHQGAIHAIAYMQQNIEHYGNYAYLIEKCSNEVKLGGNAVAIIMLSQYMLLYKTDKYVELCKKLGEGILKMFDVEKVSFVHVLNSEDLSVKEEYRTVYYDGEAAFALVRLYRMTKEKKWLDAAQRGVEHFIECNYIKYRDHWVAYAVNELTMYLPEEKYFEFGLRNVQENMDIIYNQPTSYHTYLELLMVSFDLYMRIKKNGYDVKYLEQFDSVRFIETIFHRAHHMLNGYAYPEYVMYFKKPEYFLGSFFVRHDGYRTRIDDVQHFCGAYISMYKLYDDLVAEYKAMQGEALDYLGSSIKRKGL